MPDLAELTEIQLAKEMAELTCNLSKTCQEKEKYFASLFNLTPAEFRCLRLFNKENVRSIKEIANELALTPGRITHILTSLEDKKLIERRVDPTDKRNVLVHITPQSRPFLNNIQENHVLIHQEILDKIDEENREVIIFALRETLKALKTWKEDKI
ncbi:MAG: MarR family transcriptional regulator [Ignavibacteria bacterium]|nr:MAG: MarR family transcriptional regulator [Ignavibacteria bacterium]